MENWNTEFAIHEGKSNSFEGWYIRIQDDQCSLAVIFGLSYGKDAHAFIQIMDTLTQKSQYVRYSMEEVWVRMEPFVLHIGPSYLSEQALHLSLDSCAYPIEADVNFSPLMKLPATRYAPTIMGPFSYWRRMECIHSLISLKHVVQGRIRIQDSELCIQGVGYIEKDRGTSFPSSYLWLQSNACKEADASIFLALARIPMYKLYFQGVLCVLRIGNQLYRFASYYGATASIKKYGDEKVMCILYQGSMRLYVKIEKGKGRILAAPIQGGMKETVVEGLEGVCSIQLYRGMKKLTSLHFTGCGNEFYHIDE